MSQGPDDAAVVVGLVGHGGDHVVAAIGGEIDHTCAALFRDSTLALLVEGDRHVVLDMSEVGFCDSSGIAALVDLLRHTRGRDGSLRLAAMPPNVSRAIQVAGLGDLIPAHPTVAAALAALAAPHPSAEPPGG